MATAIQDAQSGSGNATCRYYGILSDLAAGDTIGITIESDTYLHTVPAGGQDLFDALKALAVLAAAGGYGARVSLNAPYDHALHVQGAAGADVALSLPVYVVA